MVKKKKTLIISGVIGLLAIGGTIAYNHNHKAFQNLFHLGEQTMEYSETFESPTNWQPCQTIDKTFTATNRSSWDMAVRFRVEEFWKTKNSTSADFVSDLDLYQNDQPIAVINYDLGDDWELRDDGYYYYKSPLAPGDSTPTPITSVTMNCNANLAGVTTYSADGKTSTTSDSGYEEAQYHAVITIQGVPSEGAETAWSGNTLYDKIASLDNNGTDENIDFRMPASSSNTTGINIRKGTEEDDFPIYYYRGDVSNNYAVWGNYCWKILRTTETGGVKLMYSSNKYAVNGNTQCPDRYTSGSFQWSVGNASYNTKIGANDYLAASGYMFGDATIGEINHMGFAAGTVFTFANNVTYSNGMHHLVTGAGESVTGTIDDILDDVKDKYHYFCAGNQTSCSTVYYYMYGSSPLSVIAIPSTISNIEELKNRAFANTVSSTLKTNTEEWAKTALGALVNDLGDSIFCNDRTFYSGTLISKDSPSTGSVVFSSDWRNTDGSNGFHPSYDCAEQRDSFTKQGSSRGNGKLKYGIGALTADEAMFADPYNGFVKVFTSEPLKLMTPMRIESTSGIKVGVLGYSFGSEPYYSGYGMRPVIALRHSAQVTGGTGTVDNPYIIKTR